MKLGAIRLFVRELAVARRFYQSLLALPLSHDGSTQGWCTFDLGGVHLVIESVPPDAPEDEQALVGRFSGVSFAVDDIQAEHARLRAAGVWFDGPPEQQAWGGWLASFEDPAGNQLQLAQYPKR